MSNISKFNFNKKYVLFKFYRQIAEKKKKLKKEGKSDSSTILEEDNEKGYRHAVYVMTMKLFADMERRR